MGDNNEHSLIKDSVARLFSGEVSRATLERAEGNEWPAALWQASTNAGLSLALAAESAGGLGLGWRDSYPILHGLGYWQVPIPLAETLVATHLLAAAGVSTAQVCRDGTYAPIALVDEHTARALRLTAVDATTGHIDGTTGPVAWARWCDYALIGLSDGRCALVALKNNPQVDRVQGVDSAGMPADRLSLSSAQCVTLFKTRHGHTPIRVLGAAARAAMMSGALQWTLEQSVRYAQDRVQFGKPIGRNQALQQSLALLAGEVAASRMAAQAACADLDAAEFKAAEPATGVPADAAAKSAAARFSVAVAKIRAGEAAGHAIAISHQVHGAMGFTREHALHFATRRLWSWRREFGTESWWAERLGQAAIARGSASLWPAITSRELDPLT
jgi:acyl-CoA dehydrogenase